MVANNAMVIQCAVGDTGVINFSNGSPSFELALVPESCIEKIAEKLDDAEHLSSDAFYKLFDEVKTTVYRCPSCGRIHVDKGGGLFNSFVLDG